MIFFLSYNKSKLLKYVDFIELKLLKILLHLFWKFLINKLPHR